LPFIFQSQGAIEYLVLVLLSGGIQVHYKTTLSHLSPFPISNIQNLKRLRKKGPCSIKLSWANPWVPLIFEREPGAPNERTVLDASIPCFVEHMHRAQRTPNRPGVVWRATSSQRYLSQKPRNIRHSMFLTVLSHDFFPSRTFGSVKTKRYHQPFVFVFLPHPNSHHSNELWNHAIHCYPLLYPHSIQFPWLKTS
jgi:hypothetical protein